MFFIIFVLVVFLIIYFFGKDLRHRFFAWFMHQFTKKQDPKYQVVKKSHFESIHSVVSHDPALRKEKAIKILEVGVGTGANFKFYPDGTRLIVVDPNPHFKSYYDNNRSKFPNIKSENIIVSSGEEMNMVESNSIDVVVMTLVMCSVSDVAAVVKEIHRVLAQGGKFYFWEHIREWNGKEHWFRQTLHDFLSYTRIWPVIFDNCHLDRDMLSAIEETGFSKVDGKRSYAPVDHWFFQLIKPHLTGVATK